MLLRQRDADRGDHADGPHAQVPAQGPGEDRRAGPHPDRQRPDGDGEERPHGGVAARGDARQDEGGHCVDRTHEHCDEQRGRLRDQRRGGPDRAQRQHGEEGSSPELPVAAPLSQLVTMLGRPMLKIMVANCWMTAMTPTVP